MSLPAPKVSVLMPVYNGERYLLEATSSILSQTEADFELVVVNDGSTDRSRYILRSISDPRLVVVDEPHGGLVAALNTGIVHCRGVYIARMDADDVAAPTRLAEQAAYLDNHAGCAFCSSNVELIDESGAVFGYQDQDDLPRDELRDGLTGARRMLPIIHPSMMMRRDALVALGGYRPYHSAEDRDLWLRAIDRYGFHRLQRRLLKYRMLSSSISRTRPLQQTVSGALAVVNYLVRAETSVDLHTERPDLWQLAYSALERGCEKLAPSGVQHFRAGRQKMRTGQQIEGALMAAGALLRHGPVALPARFDSRVHALARRVATQMIAQCSPARGNG